jgi:flagellar export protein FliJ
MKKFHFSLEAVVRLRIEQLEKTKQIYAEGLQWKSRASAAVSAAEAEINSCHDALTTRRETRTTRTDQLLFLNALQYQQSLLAGLQEELARAERELEVRRGAMLFAQRKVDALERLRERKLRTHRAAMQRAEETLIDDLIGARYVLQTAEVAT